jgi:hypothetical protein
METASALSSLGSIAMERLKKSIEPLKNQIEAIDSLLSPGHADLMAIERSAELQKQRAEAAAKVAEAEERILRLQEQQSRLSFLEAQVRLLEIIKENKLNKSDILGDLKLGVDADMGEVIDATVKALEKLIDKAEDKLEIGSPSKRFMKMGQMSAQGFGAGWQKGMIDVSQHVANGVGNLPVGMGYDDRLPGGGGGESIIIQVSADVLGDRNKVRKMARYMAEEYKRAR